MVEASLIQIFFEPEAWRTALIFTLLMFGYGVISLIVLLMGMSVFNKLRYWIAGYKFDPGYSPSFSVIVPAYNEDKVIARTIRSFLKTSYPAEKKEIIIVNDGSGDKTLREAERYASVVVDSDTGERRKRRGGFRNVTLVNRTRGGRGKAHVLNDGRRFSNNSILLIIDADIQLSRDIFERAATHFADKRVGAVAGYIQVSEKRGKILNDFVNFETTIAQKVMRLGFDTIGIHYIIPGGCGFFRRNVMNAVGDYEADTLAEDTDMTFRMMTETKKKIHFDPSVDVVADEPTDLFSLWNQRIRWARGNFGVTRKHLNRVGKRMYGKAVTYGYPFWIASIIIPLTFLITTSGLLLNSALKVDITSIAIFGRVMAFVFIGIWVIGALLSRGRSWFAGLISPGAPMLITMFSSMLLPHGLEELVSVLGFPGYGGTASLILLLWIASSVFLVYPVVLLSRKRPKLANAIQLSVFGYWVVLVVSGIYGYIKEMRKDDPVWIRTVR